MLIFTIDARRYVLPAAAAANPTIATIVKTTAPELFVPREFGDADNPNDACDANRVNKSAMAETATVKAVKSIATSVKTAVATAIPTVITQSIRMPITLGV